MCIYIHTVYITFSFCFISGLLIPSLIEINANSNMTVHMYFVYDKMILYIARKTHFVRKWNLNLSI